MVDAANASGATALRAPDPALAAAAHADAATYERMYAASIADPDAFWAEQARRIDWMRPPTKIKTSSFDSDALSIKWFEDGTLNVCANCVDRHLDQRAHQT
ncbi:MAG: acetyl-coenzyme A synthetase N-terminal domain-containing protein, partial [Pseudomonadota bacterium]